MGILWRARYKDGTTLEQYNSDGEANGYENINRDKLDAFEIFDSKDKRLILRMFLEPEQRLIYRRRVWQDFRTGNIKFYLYMIGWQQTIKGQNIQSLNYIYPDGHVEQGGKWIGGPPVLEEYEKKCQ